MHLPPVSEEVKLPEVEAPYLGPMRVGKEFTLVLDLDETLIHYEEAEEGHELRVRPGAKEFLREMSQWYELVVFTAGMQDYADWVLD